MNLFGYSFEGYFFFGFFCGIVNFLGICLFSFKEKKDLL